MGGSLNWGGAPIKPTLHPNLDDYPCRALNEKSGQRLIPGARHFPCPASSSCPGVRHSVGFRVEGFGGLEV